jgi:hypothetical protein
MNTNKRTFFEILCVAAILAVAPITLAAQNAVSENGASERSVMKTTIASVVQVLTGTGDGLLRKRGAGVIIREDGVILTSYELIKNASQVQVRLPNGEIFDRVDLLDFDERRGVAALKISGSGLPVVPKRETDIEIGEAALVVSNADGRTWEVTDGLIRASRFADEIPDAGTGFRVFQITASLESSSNGGLITDVDGRAIGIAVVELKSGNRSHNTVPLSSVLELGAVSSKTMSFGNGQSLDLEKPSRPPSAIEIVSSDPATILRNAQLFYVDSGSFYIKSEMMENAMMREPEFKTGALKIVSSRATADILIFVKHKLFTWDYRYTVTDRRTGILLASEKVTVIDGKAASYKFAKKLLTLLRKHKKPAAVPNSTE